MSSTTVNPLSILTSPLTFTGVSQFSNDYQTILNHAQQVGAIPIQMLQNQQAAILAQKQALIGLTPFVSSLGQSLSNLGMVASSQGLAASSSDPSSVQVTNTGASSPAAYTISSIQSLASAASETSVTGYADNSTAPVSSTGTVRLVVGTKTYEITLTPQTNNLNGLVQAINGLGAGVTANVLTTGNGSNPNYLSISANTTGATTLQLIDDPAGAATNLITSNNQGTDAVFQFNGIPVTRSTNTVNDLVPGLSLQLLQTTTGPVSLGLQTDPSQLSNALSSFIQNYNNLVDQVKQQVGTSAGPLSGNLIITTIESDLRQLTSYQGTGAVKSLSDLGIRFDTTGHLTFDQNAFASLSSAQITGAFTFLGSASSGLSSLAQTFNQLSDPVSGMIAAQENGNDQINSHLSDQIQTLTARLNRSQTALQQQLAAADTLAASLESQQKILAGSIQSMNFVAFGYQQNQSGSGS
jgi:flagellar hook-associated protein 2